MRVEETCKCSAKIVVESEWPLDIRTQLNEFRELHSDCLVVDMEPTKPAIGWLDTSHPTPWYSINKVDLDKLDDVPDPVLNSINRAFH